MKKRFLCLFIVMTMLLMIGATAVTPRYADLVSGLNFENNVAACSARVIGTNIAHTITITMELKHGSTVIDEWSTTGTGIVKLEKTATVQANKTYTLYVDVVYNGEVWPTITHTETNN